MRGIENKSILQIHYFRIKNIIQSFYNRFIKIYQPLKRSLISSIQDLNDFKQRRNERNGDARWIINDSSSFLSLISKNADQMFFQFILFSSKQIIIQLYFPGRLLEFSIYTQINTWSLIIIIEVLESFDSTSLNFDICVW